MAKFGKYTPSKAPPCADGSKSSGGDAPVSAAFEYPRKRPMPSKKTFVAKDNGKYDYTS